MPFRKKGSPYWYYDIIVNGSRFRGSTGQKSRTEAKKVEDRIRREKAEPNKRTSCTLDHAAGQYLHNVASHQSSAPTTEYQCKNLLKGLGRNIFLSEIAAKNITEFAVKRRANVSDSSVNREIELLRRIINYADASLGADVPKIHWKALKYKEPPGRVRELSADEERRLFLALREDLHDFVRCALMTGARLSSITGLLWRNVDFDARQMSFIQKGGTYHHLPLTTRLLALLANQPRAHDDYVFTYICQKSRKERKKDERYPLIGGAWKKPWKAALNAAGITDFRFHDTRHTAATRLMRTTGNLKMAQRQLGHADISSTARYAHVTDNDLREAMEAVENKEVSRNPHAMSGHAKTGSDDK